MKRWEKCKAADGTETHLLKFAHHGIEEKQIVCLFRDNDTGDWYTTSDLLNTFWEFCTLDFGLKFDLTLSNLQ